MSEAEPEDIAVATMTWARDEREAEALREALPLLAGAQRRVFVADGGSGSDFLRFLHELPGFTVCGDARPGVCGQARTSLRAAYASGAPFVLYTEPDKRFFFGEKLERFLAGSTSGRAADLTLAARSPASLATFPAFQQYTEGVINHLCAATTGLEADYSYGPFLLRRDLIPLLDEITDEAGWGWRPYLFALTHRLGRRVAARLDDLPCPPEQRVDDAAERLHRLRQLSQNVQGLVLAAGVKDLKFSGAV